MLINVGNNEITTNLQCKQQQYENWTLLKISKFTTLPVIASLRCFIIGKITLSPVNSKQCFIKNIPSRNPIVLTGIIFFFDKL